VVWREERSRPSSAGHAEIEDAEIDELLRRDQLIAAIKRYRELSGLGLREAKDAMEARRRKLR
jgi:ribosomal protein L7/L12